MAFYIFSLLIPANLIVLSSKKGIAGFVLLTGFLQFAPRAGIHQNYGNDYFNYVSIVFNDYNL